MMFATSVIAVLMSLALVDGRKGLLDLFLGLWGGVSGRIRRQILLEDDTEPHSHTTSHRGRHGMDPCSNEKYASRPFRKIQNERATQKAKLWAIRMQART